MYADDTVMNCADHNNKRLRKMFQADLNKVQAWCTQNRLTLNVKKTKIMTFMSGHKRKRHQQFIFYMKGVRIDVVVCYKYLGTIIDNRLSGDSQHTKLLQTLYICISAHCISVHHLTNNRL